MEDTGLDGRPPSSLVRSQTEVTQQGEGRWHIDVVANRRNRPKNIAGLPKAVIEGDGGPVDTAPPVPIGLEGTMEFLSAELWVLTVESTPSHQTYEGETMLLAPGDRLLFG